MIKILAGDKIKIEPKPEHKHLFNEVFLDMFAKKTFILFRDWNWNNEYFYVHCDIKGKPFYQFEKDLYNIVSYKSRG